MKGTVVQFWLKSFFWGYYMVLMQLCGYVSLPHTQVTLSWQLAQKQQYITM